MSLLLTVATVTDSTAWATPVSPRPASSSNAIGRFIFFSPSSVTNSISGAALRGGSIDSASGISPNNLKDLNQGDIRTSPLNRVFGVFFNQNQSTLLRDKTVRSALNDSARSGSPSREAATPQT